ncbi:hypothetical protein PVAP13_5KG083874 [Panicum virgatum]|uniref:Uncharacterized protein n=1 Tax=Panicum virgatum TaxID=38727 RepID=A0A8T0SGW0_PANVG|nr:hypothetical protein PVAP13_5KG083874 [Panicum virgatum]
MAGGPHEDESATVTFSHPMPLLVPIVHDGVLGCLGDEGQQITQVVQSTESITAEAILNETPDNEKFKYDHNVLFGCNALLILH